MSIEKQGMQALFMQQAWILGSAFFFRHDQDGKWHKNRSVHIMKDVGVRDALPPTKQPARWR